MSQVLENVTFFLERLKDRTPSNYNRVKIFDVRVDAKPYRVSQRITGSWKMQFFDSKFYAEQRMKLF